MKILIFSDMHGNKNALERLIKKAHGVDLLVCAGDLSNMGRDLEGILKRLDIGIPLFIIHGNHESEDEMKGVCSMFPTMRYIHRASLRFKGFVFFGYGGGGFAIRDTVFESLMARLKKDLKPGDKVVLVTHAPPHGTKLDYLPHAGHRGCISIRRFIDEIRPVLHICGHLHENVARKQIVDGTLVINPGPEGKIIRL